MYITLYPPPLGTLAQSGRRVAWTDPGGAFHGVERQLRVVRRDDFPSSGKLKRGEGVYFVYSSVVGEPPF